MSDFDKLVERSGTDSHKWQKYHDRDIIPMWVADMDFASPPAVLEALHQRVSHGVFGYGKPGQALTESILAYLTDAFQWTVQPEWIVWLPGLVTGLNVACRSVGSARASILTTVPIYPPFLTAPKQSDRRLLTSPMVFDEDRWQMNMEDLARAIDEHTSLFMLCNPHNPTGRVFTREELETVTHLCLSRDLIICSDEIHCDLILEPGCRHIPLATLAPEIENKTITLMAPSKTFNIPGLSCAFAIIANSNLRRRFKHAMAGIVPLVNVLGLAATQAAYSKGKPWLEALLLYLRENRNMVYRSINAMNGLQMGPVEATYLAWIDARSLDNIEDLVGFFEEAGVGLSDGADFGAPGFVRMNFGCSRQLLSTALERMGNALTGT